MKYKRNPSRWQFIPLTSKLLLLAVLSFAISGMVFSTQMLANTWIAVIMPESIWTILAWIGNNCIVNSVVLLIATALSPIFPKSKYITSLIKRALFDPSRGNPLRLREGQYLPTIRCKKCGPEQGQFLVRISTAGFTPEQIRGLASVISPALTGRVKNYAVTKVREDMARNFFDFFIEDTTTDYRLVFSSAEEMLRPPITQLLVGKQTTIDLKTSGSIICAGKTRSGKTTGIISQLLQVVLRPGPIRV